MNVTDSKILDFIKGQMKVLIDFSEVGTEQWKTYTFIIRSNFTEEEQEVIFDEIRAYKASKETK